MKKLNFAFILFIFLFPAFSLFSENLLIKNVRLIDGTGAPARENMSVLIRGSRIAKIGQDLKSGGARVLDAQGATLLPGLIDAHVHLTSVPGSTFRKDSIKTLWVLRKKHLKAYLACGVTTVLDNAIRAPLLRTLQTYMKQGGVGPRIYALGPVFHTPGGYLDGDILAPSKLEPLWPATGNLADIQALFEMYAGFPNIVGVKVPIEFGFGPLDIWEIHSEDMRELIKKESAKRKQPIFVHGFSQVEQSIGVAMGAHNLVHGGFWEEQPSEEFLRNIKKQGTFLTTTLSTTVDVWLNRFEPQRYQDPLIRLTVPGLELDAAMDPASFEFTMDKLAEVSVPWWIPSFLARWGGAFMMRESKIRSNLTSAGKAIHTMYKAGVPIVMGSDSGNWPHNATPFHGPSSIREVELLGELGMSPLDVISSSTRIPAEMMGVQKDLGTIEVGKLADMILVKEDPLKNLSALRNLEWVMKGGVIRRPQEWIGEK